MSCQGVDSTEETPPGAGHLGASHAKFKSSVTWLGGLRGAKREEMFTARAGKEVLQHRPQAAAAGSPLPKSAHPQGWGQSSTPALPLLQRASQLLSADPSFILRL